MIHSFLLIGQSNAAGRGIIKDAPPLNNCNRRLKVLRNGRWQTMFRPVNPDRAFSGTCLAESFCLSYAEAEPDIEVGVIPCADGGTSLNQWAPGGLLFDNAVNCAKLAMRTSHLTAVLWHQGEGDCAPELYSTYAERFTKMIDALREELKRPDLPVLVGGLGDFLSECPLTERLKNYVYVNEQLEKVAKEYPHCAYVSAVGLGSNPDKLHFNAQALYEFGIRYYEQFKGMGITCVTESEGLIDDSARTEMEHL